MASLKETAKQSNPDGERAFYQLAKLAQSGDENAKAALQELSATIPEAKGVLDLLSRGAGTPESRAAADLLWKYDVAVHLSTDDLKEMAKDTGPKGEIAIEILAQRAREGDKEAKLALKDLAKSNPEAKSALEGLPKSNPEPALALKELAQSTLKNIQTKIQKS